MQQIDSHLIEPVFSRTFAQATLFEKVPFWHDNFVLKQRNRGFGITSCGRGGTVGLMAVVAPGSSVVATG